MPVPAIPPAWSTQDSLQRVEDAAHGRGSQVRVLTDGSLMLSCVNPAHDDRTPSLHASWEATEHGGRTLLYCPACGPGIGQEEWADLLDLEYDDLFDDRRWSLHNRSAVKNAERSSTRRLAKRGDGKSPGPLPKRITAVLDELLDRQPAPMGQTRSCEHEYAPHVIYPYRDPATNRVVQQVIRHLCTVCADKTFRQSYATDGRRWVNKEPSGFTSVLYRHREVLEAIAAGEDVWLLEGEKDADTAARAGLCSTTNARGGAHFPAELATVFAGGHVSVVLDNDATGWARGAMLHPLLEGAGAATVRLLLPAIDELKADFTDHIDAGHPVDALIEHPWHAISAWAGLDEVKRAVARVQSADDEARAQLEVAAHDTKQGRRAKAEDRRRFAARWVTETERAFALVQAAARKVAEHVAAVPGDRWAEQAGQIATAQVVSAASLARSTHELVGVPVPSELSVQAVRDSAAAAVVASVSGASESAVTATDSEASHVSGRPDLQVVEGGGSGGGGSSRWLPGVEILKTRYDAINGEIVRVERIQVGRGETAEWQSRYHRVINKVVRVTRKEQAEADEDIEREMLDIDSLGDRDGRTRDRVTNLQKITHVVFGYTAGDGTEMRVRVPQDDAESGAWLAHLGEPGLDYLRTRSGREKVMTAIHAISDDYEVSTSYRATGWRHRPDGTWMYVTADGAIDAGGYQPVLTNLTGPLSRFSWPNPTTDPDRLRQAFLRDSAGLCGPFPDRVATVLVGHAYRSVLGPCEWVTVLSGSPATGKTGLAALTMHHFGELWDRHRPMSSMSGNGATFNALRLLANQAKDALSFYDDNAPTAGLDQAWKRLEETIRLISNQEARPRSERDGQGVLPSSRPRTSALITTELPPRAGTSGERRGLIVPLNKIDVSIDDIKAMDAMESRHGRALLTASFLQWLASDLRAFLARAGQLREEFLADMAGTPRHPKAWDRHGAKVAELWAGWALMLEFLLEQGALSQDEAQQWRARVTAALHVAAESCEDPDLVSCTGERVAELLRFALSSGAAYVRDIRTGEAPTGLERQLGWQPHQRATPGGGFAPPEAEWRHDPRAIFLGYVNTEPTNTDEHGRELVCDSPALEATLKAAAQAMADTTGIDLGTVLRALEEEGILKISLEKRAGGVVPRRKLVRTIWTENDAKNPDKPLRAKRVVIRLDELLESDPDGPDGDQPLPFGAPEAGPDDGVGRGGHGDGVVDQDVAGCDSPETKAVEAVGTHTNQGGLGLMTGQLEAPQPCRVCGKRCAVTFDRIPMHLPCYWGTTAKTVMELHRQTDTLPAAVAVGSPAPNTSAPTVGDTAQGTASATVDATVPAEAKPARVAGSKTMARAQRKAAKAATYDFRASVAVVDVDVATLPDGTTVDLEAPITHLGHLEQVGRALNLGHAPMAWRTQPEAGIVIPTDAVWAQLGIEADQVPERPSKKQAWMVEVSRDLPALTQAVEQGWVFGRGDRDPVLRGLTRLRRADADRGSVAVMFTPGMPQGWGLDGEPAAVARRMQLFADAVGLPFRGNPITTGLDLLSIVLPKATREALAPAEAFDYSDVAPTWVNELEAQFDWTRTPLPSERQARWLALYDRGGSYLAGWSSLLLGIGPPQLLEGEAARFDARCAGWWLVQLPEATEDRDPYPNILDPQGNLAGREVWVTTPALEYATAAEPRGLGWDVPVIKAWAWPPERSKQVLKPLQEVLRDALAQLQDYGSDDADAKAAATLVKQVYKQLGGYFASENSDLTRKGAQYGSATLNAHQPYWFHAMCAQARRAILHQILTIGRDTGRWPLVASNNDLIGYAVDEPDLEKAWPGKPGKYGFGLGAYKAARWDLMGAHATYLTGKGWSGRDATTTVDTALPDPDTPPAEAGDA